MIKLSKNKIIIEIKSRKWEKKERKKEKEEENKRLVKTYHSMKWWRDFDPIATTKYDNFNSSWHTKNLNRS
jgi:TPP-dependent pyruvate/acetoin dehydrogenase alpha subunit